MDLVGLGDLKGPDRALIAKGGHTHALRTANGATRTAGRVDADVGNLDEVIEAHVLESTPSIISVGKRCHGVLVCVDCRLQAYSHMSFGQRAVPSSW